MTNHKQLIFLHGLEGSSKGVKATMLRALFPGIIVPDMSGSLDERMRVLRKILGNKKGWTIIGSSFGGLMGATFTCLNPDQVDRLIMFAPALIWPDFANSPPKPVSVPTIMYHGTRDKVIPLDAVKKLAEGIFLNLTLHIVDDDHGLYKTVHEIDWKMLVSV